MAVSCNIFPLAFKCAPPPPHIPPHAISPAFPPGVGGGRNIQMLYLKVLILSFVNIHFILYNLQQGTMRSSLSVHRCDNVFSKMALSSLE